MLALPAPRYVSALALARAQMASLETAHQLAQEAALPCWMLNRPAPSNAAELYAASDRAWAAYQAAQAAVTALEGAA